MHLRPHQTRTVDAVRSAFRRVRRVLIVAPTGFGKTAVAAQLIAWAVARGHRVLFLVHLREVVLDTARRLGAAGVPCGVVMAGVVATEASVQVACIGTVAAREAHPAADLVIWDEAHHAAADTYRAIAAQYPRAWHLGLTATPERADGAGLRDAFDELVVGATVRELVVGGYLAPIDIIAPAARLQGLAEDPVEAWARVAPGRPTVAFCRTVAESSALAESFAARGLRAAHVDGGTPKRQRGSALAAFAAGCLDVLTNVYVLTEGWDAPRAEVCLMARGCGSDAMFLQTVGRVRRLAHPGQRAMLIDLAGVVHEHGHPDEDRVYTLDGVARRAKEDREWLAQCRACGCVVEGSRRGARCPQCGAAWPAPKPTKIQPAALQAPTRIVTRAEKESVLRGLVETAEQRGYRAGWVGMEFKRRYGHWPAGLPMGRAAS